MEFAVMAIAAGCVTVMIIVALRIDHEEWKQKRREKYGKFDQAS